MKVKVKTTGEIVDVYHEPQHGQISNIYKESVLVNGRMWAEDELDFCVKVNEAPEKIYVDDFGSELSHDWHTEHSYETSIEYTRTDAFIEKACNFIRERLIFDDNAWYIEGEVTLKDRVIENFKKYMKGE